MPLSGEITSPDVGRVLPDHDRGTSVKCQADGYGIDHVRELLRLSDVCDPRAIPDPSVKPARRAPERWGDRQRLPRLYPPLLLTGVLLCVGPRQIEKDLFGGLDPGTLVPVQHPRVSVAVIYQHGRLDPGTHGLPSCSAHDSSVSPLRIVTRGSSSSSSVSRSYSPLSGRRVERPPLSDDSDPQCRAVLGTDTKLLFERLDRLLVRHGQCEERICLTLPCAAPDPWFVFSLPEQSSLTINSLEVSDQHPFVGRCDELGDRVFPERLPLILDVRAQADRRGEVRIRHGTGSQLDLLTVPGIHRCAGCLPTGAVRALPWHRDSSR